MKNEGCVTNWCRNYLYPYYFRYSVCRLIMFGISVKVWKMGSEGEEFSLIITHCSSVQKFLLLYLNQLETEFRVGKETIEEISTSIHPSLLETLIPFI